MNKPLTRAQILKDIRLFCKSNAISTTEFGVRALNDSSFYGRLSNGKSPTLDRIERVYNFMSEDAQLGDSQQGAYDDIIG
jgi:hypothetical protein